MSYWAKDLVMILLKRILVTTDLSNHSCAAFEHAFSLGLLYNAPIYLLYVANDAPPLATLYGMRGDEHVHHEQIESAAMKKLEEFVAKNTGAERRVTPVVRTGDPAMEIATFAAEQNSDLIVMATHGWTGFKHLVLGSVAETVVRHATVPVLTVKPPSNDEPVLNKQDVESELHLN
jgi:nucleotide-binding universal stress UspA family protein